VFTFESLCKQTNNRNVSIPPSPFLSLVEDEYFPHCSNVCVFSVMILLLQIFGVKFRNVFFFNNGKFLFLIKSSVWNKKEILQACSLSSHIWQKSYCSNFSGISASPLLLQFQLFSPPSFSPSLTWSR